MLLTFPNIRKRFFFLLFGLKEKNCKNMLLHNPIFHQQLTLSLSLSIIVAAPNSSAQLGGMKNKGVDLSTRTLYFCYKTIATIIIDRIQQKNILPLS